MKGMTRIKKRLLCSRLKPWFKSTLKKAHQKTGREWDALEEAATKAQGKPDSND
jgi:hypothetical protein